METRTTLQQTLTQIEKWENEQKDLWFWEKFGRLPFVLLDKWTPGFVQEKAGRVLDEMAGYVESGGKYLINERSVLDRFTPTPSTQSDIAGLPLATMDAVAADLRSARSNFATVQGATTGIGGIFTLAVDIPLLESFSELTSIAQPSKMLPKLV